VAASVRQRIAFGERAGEKVRRVGHGFGYEGEQPELKGMRCATVNGFSLHANTDVAAHRRDQLERLLRYTARGAAIKSFLFFLSPYCKDCFCIISYFQSVG
jgi:hypothetical protein